MKQSLPKWIRDIEDRAGGKPVLLVEGNSDEKIISRLLDILEPSWNTSCELFAVGQKERLLRAFESDNLHGWVGIIDRDEWSPEYIVERAGHLSNVKVLPRFCIENYFCVPDELWNMLPSKATVNIPDRKDTLKNRICTALPAWVAHGAMWRVIRQHHRLLVFESRFPGEFDSRPITDENEIRAILQRWHSQLEPEVILAEYREELKNASEKPEKEQLSQYVHGKKFFRQIVVPTLNSIFAQDDYDTWLERLIDTFVIPDDMAAFLREILEILSA